MIDFNMILKETLVKIVNDQKERLNNLDLGVIRELAKDIEINTELAVIISGIRRCGKSTLSLQLVRKQKQFYYFNFEDPRLAGFEQSDFSRLKEALIEVFGSCELYLLDEIQNVPGWESFVRAELDNRKKFIITGSNASLLSRELGTKLTGRHIRYELLPFSYNEYLRFKSEKATEHSFEGYLLEGGFPEFLKYKNDRILQELFDDIITRDIIVRYKLRNPALIKKIAVYLMSNVGREFTYNGLARLFELGSANSMLSFISYFEGSYLIFTVPKFDYSLRKQIRNPKKLYVIDNALARYNSTGFSEDMGRLLENLVFLSLRRYTKDIYYFKQKKECDFLVKQKGKITDAIQVCYKLSEENKDREINGLLEAMEEFDLENALILTYNQEDEITVDNKKIYIKPVWRWLLKLS